MSAMEIMAKLGLKNRANFRKNYLVPALEGNFIEPTSNIKNNLPDKNTVLRNVVQQGR